MLVKVCGSGDNQELLRRLATAYETLHPGIDIEVADSIGSSGGVKATAKGRCDIGRLARPLKEKEKRYGLSYTLFARSPVVFLVSENINDVKGITARQVVDVFSGKITSWQDLGGGAGNIYIANREKGDSSRTVIGKLLPDFARISKQVGQTIYSTPETIDTIAGHDNVIAYAPLSAVINRDDIHVLAFEGVLPSVETITTGRYPLYSDYGLVCRSDVSQAALAFMKFMTTDQAKSIISDFGAAPVFSEQK